MTLGVASSSGCAGSEETRYVHDVPVHAGVLHSFETDKGFTIVLDEVELAIHAIHFTQAGEAHEASRRPLLDLLLPVAYAHPGHSHGGETTGELHAPATAHFAFDTPAAPFGYADLAHGEYDAADLILDRIGSDESCSITAPQTAELDMRPTLRLAGSAEKDEAEYFFSLELLFERCRPITGIPFEAHVTDAGGTVVMSFDGQSRYEGREGGFPTIFDGIEFDSVPAERNASGELLLHTDRPTETTLKARLRSHDFYSFELRP